MTKKVREKKPTDTEKKVDVEALLRTFIASATPSEHSVASYMLDNIQMLSFETGGSIAKAVNVSEMTVSRVVKGLGFESLRNLKKALRTSVEEKDGEFDDYMLRFKVHDKRQQALQESLKLELDAISKAYSLATTELWDEATSALVKTRTVYVVGFQAIKGLAMDFASRLLWTRPNVIFVESASGSFGEIIAADPKQSIVVMVDAADYATRGIKLAQRIKDMEMPLVIVTDKFSHWAFPYTDYVFEAHSAVKTYWDSTAAINVVLNLMIDAIAVKLGPKALQHHEKIREMAAELGDFVKGPTLRDKIDEI
ncbi:MurR/RpiR family transcriptional regulator [Brucella anthropi]|uniref:MurR/RpiR family transcriptional regulator n=1 Tax=Brucella anthropi TaxID=529 RepID=UPI000775053D|nr:MurR/RpiR family transcriptional regulator [Brucella anthropi]KXO75677.1 hypothetical protein AYJ56_09375 [Brucella anthropi]